MGLLSKLFGAGKTKIVVSRAGSYPMEVVGESNYQAALTSICGPHNRHGHDLKTAAVICREPDNQYDTNAIKVLISGQTVGYLPRAQAKRLSDQMDSSGIERAKCQAQIRGGWRTNQHDEGHFGVRLGIPNRGKLEFK